MPELITTKLGRLTQELLPTERRDFLYPPPLETEVISSAPNFPGGLVGRKIVVNERFVSEMCEGCGVAPEVVVQAIIDRSLNRFLRVPETFGEALRLYASLREEGIETKNARHYLEVYLALWNEMDLYANRGKGDQLVSLYRFSLDLPQEEQEKLPDHYRILVAVLEKAWGIDLGLRDLRGWEHLAAALAEIDYLGGAIREQDIKCFGKLFARCCQIIEKGAAKNKEEEEKREKEEEPRHWPLAGLLDSTLAATDIRAGIAEFLEAYPDKARALLLLEEFSVLNGQAQGLLGDAAALEACRWWWYAHLAEEHRLTVRKRPSRKEGRVYPVKLTTWEPGQGTHHLAPLATFGPIGLPGITKRWLQSGPESHHPDLQVPDLIVAIDSSGSMPSANHVKSYAVLAATVAANAYLDQGSRAAVLNFSSREVVEGFTKDREAVYKHLAAYQGGGTTLNPDTIEKLIGKSSREADIMLVTDLGLDAFHDTLGRLARHTGTHRLFVLAIGATHAQVDEARKTLPDTVEFHSVDNDEDLINLALGVVRRSFEAQPASIAPDKGAA